jgi:hypothetical protein
LCNAKIPDLRARTHYGTLSRILGQVMNDKELHDAVFEGLYTAAGVTLSPDEKAQLRAAYDVIHAFKNRVRKPGVNWEAKPLLGYVPKRSGLNV